MRYHAAMNLEVCPHCTGPLRSVKKECLSCGLQFEAQFTESPLMLLSGVEKRFILDFVLCSGSFKALAEKRGLSYPTVRAQLNRIIDRLKSERRRYAASSTHTDMDALIDAVDAGTLAPEAAIRELRKRRGEGDT